jgi:HEAT repeat protein
MLDRREQAGFLLKMLKQEKNPDVLYCIGVALGHLGDRRSVPALVGFANHRNPDVRFGVVFGLLGSEDPTAIQTLISLSSDKDKEVRSWATFGLGDMIEKDTSEIRETLFRRVADRSLDVRNEAILGLAKRKDTRVVELVLQDLRASNPRVYTLNAAEEFASPIFHPALKKHWRQHQGKNHSYWYSKLQDAMKACAPRSRRHVGG